MSLNTAKPLDRGFNAAVLHIASRLFPTGFDIAADAPDTFEDLKAHVAKTGRMIVSSANSEHTIFDDAEVNYAFRAWHDWHHLHGNYPFTVEGESNAALGQMLDLFELYGRETAIKWNKLIDAEVNGQARYMERHGRFPTDQVAFDVAYLDNQDAALSKADW